MQFQKLLLLLLPLLLPLPSLLVLLPLWLLPLLLLPPPLLRLDPSPHLSNLATCRACHASTIVTEWRTVPSAPHID